MTEWLIVLFGALLAAVLAIVAPKVWNWARVRANESPLRASLTLDGFDPFVQPQIRLHSLDGPGPDSWPSIHNPQSDGDSLQAGFFQDSIALGWQSVRLTVKGLTTDLIVINKVGVEILSREAPLSGWFVAPELGGGGNIRLFVCNADEVPTITRLIEFVDGRERVRRGPYTFTVSDTDVETFEVNVFTLTGTIKWGIDIYYEAGGKHDVLRIRDDRLRVTAVTPDIQRAVTTDRSGKLREEAPWGYGFAQDHADYFNSLSQ